MTYSDSYRSTLAALFCGERVRFTKGGTPVTSSDGKDGELGNDDGGANGSGDFL